MDRTVASSSHRHHPTVPIRDELFVFLAAGHDTTATTLTYALWALGRDASMQDRVAAEVTALGDRPLTVADVAALPYTTQVLDEALRLCPPAPAIGRMAMKDVVVDGYRVPAGTNRSRWQFLPFGGGPRSCIGDHFAMVEAILGLASLVRAVDVVSLNDDFPLALPFTMTADGPIPARVRARAAASAHSLSER